MIKCLLTFTSILGMACIISYTYFIWYCILKMEKLVKLLNEYVWQDSYWIDEYDNGAFITWWDGDQCFIDEHIISKNFWFIKWLVENDKIDFESENYPLKKYYPYFSDDILAIVEQDCNTYEDRCKVCYDKYESLLMLLAIQDEPIEFLISILK